MKLEDDTEPWLPMTSQSYDIIAGISREKNFLLYHLLSFSETILFFFPSKSKIMVHKGVKFSSTLDWMTPN